MTADAGVAAFDALPREEALALLDTCLAVPRWAREVADGRPYGDVDALRDNAARAAAELSDDELETALARHPRLGERAGKGHDAAHSQREQAGLSSGGDDLAARLAAGNAAYEARFDRVFLLRAAGRDGAQVLAELERRLGNDEVTERAETVTNLGEIALLRLGSAVAALADDPGTTPPPTRSETP